MEIIKMPGYTGPQACSIVGISYRQLDYWARTNLLRPSLVDARGSGSQRRYSYHDLLMLQVVKSLLDGGASLQTARRFLDGLREHLIEDLASAVFVLEEASAVLVYSDDDIVNLVRRGQGVLTIVPFANLIESLDMSIHTEREEP